MGGGVFAFGFLPRPSPRPLLLDLGLVDLGVSWLEGTGAAVRDSRGEYLFCVDTENVVLISCVVVAWALIVSYSSADDPLAAAEWVSTSAPSRWWGERASPGVAMRCVVGMLTPSATVGDVSFALVVGVQAVLNCCMAALTSGRSVPALLTPGVAPP